MTIQINTSILGSGLTLARHYDDQVGSADTQCGTVDWYINFIHDMAQNSLEYYNQADGSNKFLRRITLNVYGYTVPYEPAAANFLGGPLVESFCCIDDGNHSAHIDARYLANDLAYRFPASLSHEFGHAYHYWSGWPSNPTWGQEFRVMWERMVATNHNSFAEGGAPWGPGWNAWEAYANAFRCLKGCQVTRGIPDVPTGMESAVNHPAWKTFMELTPELCGFLETYGLKPGTLGWHDWYFMFQQTDGTYIYQDGPNSWHKWAWSWSSMQWEWQSYSPTYTRI